MPSFSAVPVSPEVGRIASVLVFLAAVTVIAELADRAGLFRAVAQLAARAARGSGLLLWLLVVLASTACTVLLSLDTTVVLLTPVVLVLALRLNLSVDLFAYTTVWLANTASLLLPVSNLTNLLALSWLPADRVGGAAQATVPGFLRLMWPAALAVLVISVGVLAILHRQDLRRSYRVPAPERVGDPVLLGVAAVVSGGLVPAIALGADITLVAVIAAVLLVAATALRDRQQLSIRLLPWKTMLGVGLLFLLVQALRGEWLLSSLTALSGEGGGTGDLLRMSTVAAAGSNLLNNLPWYLAMEPVADSPHRVAALLVGTNAGPLLLPWGSVATLLWAARCRAAGVQVDWRRFAVRGLVLVPLLVIGGTVAVAWTPAG